jgi:magnesium-transporting ATPase (P-type)
MSSDNDLPQQLDTLQQQPPLTKKKRNPFWKIIFISLLIVHLGFGCWWLLGGERGLGSIGVFILVVMLFAPIDLVVVLSYIITQPPQGIAKVICYSVLILISFYLIQLVGVFIYSSLFRF